jgi:DNA-binding NarL/FixJ family response regulator
MDGVSLLPLLRQRAPTSPIVVLSGTADSATAREMLAAGAMGFVHKSAGSQEMRNALDLVLQGEVYAPLALLCAGDACDVPPATPEIPDPPHLLTARQQEVLRLMAEGLPNKRIARELDISAATVKLHVSAILRALHVANRTEAALEAGRLGLLGQASVDGQSAPTGPRPGRQ